MRRDRSLRFECLEARNLLSKTHPAAAHPAQPAVEVPVELNGTLSVDNHAATVSMNADGSSTNLTPVAGRLGALGPVHGTWYESVDAFGNYQGPDELLLHAPSGAVVVTFNDQNTGHAHPDASGSLYFQHAQRATQGTGAYAHIAESGSIELVTNPGKKVIASLALTTTNS
jgi:hypothetical protein